MKIRIVMVPADRPAYVTHVENSLRNLQKIVGGNIETLTLESGMIIVCNEDGMALGLSRNENLPEFVGDVFITTASGDEFVDLDENDARTILRSVRKATASREMRC